MLSDVKGQASQLVADGLCWVWIQWKEILCGNVQAILLYDYFYDARGYRTTHSSVLRRSSYQHVEYM